MDFDLSKIDGFEWDKGKYKECEEMFYNKPLLISKDVLHSKTEERFQVLGLTNKVRLIFLAFTIRNNKIRVVSARDQNKKEAKRLQQIGGEYS